MSVKFFIYLAGLGDFDAGFFWPLVGVLAGDFELDLAGDFDWDLADDLELDFGWGLAGDLEFDLAGVLAGDLDPDFLDFWEDAAVYWELELEAGWFIFLNVGGATVLAFLVAGDLDFWVFIWILKLSFN